MQLIRFSCEEELIFDSLVRSVMVRPTQELVTLSFLCKISKEIREPLMLARRESNVPKIPE